jgi:hypothetical protein
MTEVTQTFAHGGAEPQHSDPSSLLPGVQPEPTVQVQGWCTPNLQDRRAEPAASWAHFATVVADARVVFGPDHVSIPCITCGADGKLDWCNTCEVRGNRPPEAKGFLTPMCRRCEADNVKCRLCGMRPSEGPSDWEMGNAVHFPVL